MEMEALWLSNKTPHILLQLIGEGIECVRYAVTEQNSGLLWFSDVSVEVMELMESRAPFLGGMG